MAAPPTVLSAPSCHDPLVWGIPAASMSHLSAESSACHDDSHLQGTHGLAVAPQPYSAALTQSGGAWPHNAQLPQSKQTKTSSLRYLCPYPGCSRSFQDFWRLKVHFRAPPNARGSGVERGHGIELPICPVCKTDLNGVRYHKCTAGKPKTPAQAERSHLTQQVCAVGQRGEGEVGE